MCFKGGLNVEMDDFSFSIILPTKVYAVLSAISRNEIIGSFSNGKPRNRKRKNLCIRKR